MNNLKHKHLETVLHSYSKINNPRIREILMSLIKHLFNFVDDVQLTNKEWEFAWGFMGKMAKFTYDTHKEFTPEYRNEFLLFCDLIGLSDFIEMINNPAGTCSESTGTSLLGPFYLEGVPFRRFGEASFVANYPGQRAYLYGKVIGENNQPIGGAILDIWQCDTRGLYESQDPEMPKYNLRGKYVTDKNGNYEILCLRPTGYPVPSDGPCGELLKVSNRPNLRPAHIHLIVSHAGFITLVTQLCDADDPASEDDATFSARDNTKVKFNKDANGIYRLKKDFKLFFGESEMPKSPLKHNN